MMMRHVLRSGLALTLFLALEGAGHAGSFEVSPVRANLSSGQHVAALTVRNTGHDPAVIQLQAMSWTQQESRDILNPTGDILATPPIFTLAPGASQVVRVGSRRPPDPGVETAYRLMLQEVPPPPEPGFKGLRVALKISLPIFLIPSAQANVKLVWHATPAGNGKLQLSVSNEGSAHVHLAGLTMTSPEVKTPVVFADSSVYVLPHASHAWLVDSRAGSGDTVHVVAHDDSDGIQADVVVGAH